MTGSPNGSRPRPAPGTSPVPVDDRAQQGRPTPAARLIPGRTAKSATVLVLAASVVAGAAAVASAATSHPTAATRVTVASDQLNRTVRTGLGTADRGGMYRVTAPTRASVNHGAGRISAIRPGTSFSATLTSAQAADVTMDATFSISALPKRGAVYVDLVLRRQSNGDALRAHARILPGGKVFVGMSTVRSWTERPLGTETAVKTRVVARRAFTIGAFATGGRTVRAGVRVWPATRPMPGWQRIVTTTVPATLARAGAVGTFTYVSRIGRTTAMAMFRLHASRPAGRAPVGGSAPTPTRPPTHAPSSSSAPASSAAPTTSSAPTTSAAPTTSSAPSSSSEPSTSVAPTTSSAPSSSSAPSTSSVPSPSPSSGNPTTTPAPSDPPPSEEPPADPAAQAAGALTIGQATYPVPSGAIIVSPTGSDAAPGTLAAPVRTLATAVSRAGTGGTVVMRAGVYHESVTASKTVTVQAYPSEAVWLDGSTVVTGWSADGSTWVHTGWTTEFDSTVNSSAINSSYPMAGHPDQMWIDGTELTQVGSAAAVTSGSFYADYAHNELVIGRNPADREVRAADLSTALTLKGAGSVVRGIGVRRYGNSMKDLGALRLYAKNIVAENVVVSDNGVIGAFVASTGITLRHVTLERNGMLGANANYADGLTVEGILARGNNSEHFNRSPVSGGLKITRTRGIQVRNSEFSANDGPGLWLDESCYNSMITGNRMTDNLGHGMSLEISDTAVLADNVVTNNVGNGFKINDSGNVKVWNNTLGGNKNNVALAQDERRGARASDPGHDPRQAQPDPTMPWIVHNVVVANNILMPALGGGYGVWVGDSSGEYSGPDMDLRIDGNRFVKASGTSIVLWSPSKGKQASYSTVAQYTSATGDGRSNVEAGNMTYAASMSDGTGLGLPADVAAQIDRPSGSRHVGAY